MDYRGGRLVPRQEYGLQLKATTLRTVAPITPEDIEKYLGSGMVKDFGPIFASVWWNGLAPKSCPDCKQTMGLDQSGSRGSSEASKRILGSCCSCTAMASVQAVPSGFKIYGHEAGHIRYRL